VEVRAPCARSLDEGANLRRSRDADRVGEDDLGAIGEPLDDRGDNARIDATFERTAERNADRERDRQLAPLENRVRSILCFGERTVPVARSRPEATSRS